MAPAALAERVAGEIAAALEDARSPLIVTSYPERDPAAVAALTGLCELAGIGVLESVPMRMNFPAGHPLQVGYQWNQPEQHPVLAGADVILVLGSDVPWIPAHNRPDPAARWRAVHDAQRAGWARREQPAPDGSITPECLVACGREAAPPDALFLTEAITSYPVVSEHLAASLPGSLLGSGGGSLGWAGGAAVGAKLAAPDRTVISLVGDGSYLFGVPSSAQWMARRYQAPSLTVILDNRGWKAPSLSTLAVHPGGEVAAGGFAASFQPEADLPGVAAAAGGAYARTVTAAARLPGGDRPLGAVPGQPGQPLRDRRGAAGRGRQADLAPGRQFC